MKSPLIAVVTTIQEPTRCVQRLTSALRAVGSRVIVIGDAKGPARFDIEGAEFHSLAQQLTLPFALAPMLPKGHYARKNLGYLLAIRDGAACIYETDDDNAPAKGWAPRTLQVQAEELTSRPWCNVYRIFSNELLWPRGFPLSQVRDPQTFACDATAPLHGFDAPIQQGLADGSPDVDAVWRLVLDREITFRRRASVWLPPRTWCPFNSQTTWWWTVAYPLLYLPSHCSFRMTDIWRSFVAQRCLWEIGAGLVFHAAEAIQERNVHNLMRDFRDEVPGYEKNEELVHQLEQLTLKPGPAEVVNNLSRCYEHLVACGFFPAEELTLLRAWLDDLTKLRQ